MSLTTMLAAAQGGALFQNVAAALNLPERAVKSGMDVLCPAIAAQLHDKAAADEDTYDTLLDLLDDNEGEASLEDTEGLTGTEALSDGNAMLAEIYGSPKAALTALQGLASGLPEAQLSKLAAVSANAVLVAIAQSRAPQPLAGAQQAVGGGGILGAFAEALVKGLVQGATRSLAPKRRRRRTTTSYWGRRTTRRKTTRRRTKRTPLEDIFGAILGTRR